MDITTVIILVLIGVAGIVLSRFLFTLIKRRAEFSRRALRKYLGEVAEQHEYLDMIDLRRQIRLEDVYVTLKMARKVRKPEMPGEEDRYERKAEFRVWWDRGERRIVEQLEEVKLESVLKEKCLVFRGDPGVGKTTLLRHLAYTYRHAGRPE